MGCCGKNETKKGDEELRNTRPAPIKQSPSSRKSSPPSSIRRQPRQQQSQQQPQQQPQQQLHDHLFSADYPARAGPPPASQPRNNDYTAPSGSPPARSNRGNDYAAPSGPPPSHRPQNDYVAPSGPPPNPHQARNDDYMPPASPPPTQQRIHENGYAPPPGPPPTHRNYQDDYAAPPPGPPPNRKGQDDYMAPPPGPPPSSSKPKPQHDWESIVPDTSLFPPPPSFFSGFDRSPTSNATEQEAEAGEHYCRMFPLAPPITLDRDPKALDALRTHNIRLIEPAPNPDPRNRMPGFRGSMDWRAPGVWSVHTERNATDSCIFAYPPLYAVTEHSPLATGRPKTVYYEVAISPSIKKREICVALGFTALPYPTFRMPGWHRGSLAVHGDDGHKFINDRWGGKEFTQPFRAGETYGVGMTFTPRNGRVDTDIFFTRQGRETGRWNLHEETDSQQDLPVTGLEGYHDLSCAIGTYEETAFDVIFDPAKWKCQAVRSQI
ncbi:SPRY domain-protein [Diplogelasinospora grovesii]|uniref:SPRY domain-protein n=1 Tax=Diplogelasinospora grovesii TaxID=303347 RepID=A0AAN6N643_9PEZI|nr:SPRY domain-protein [Diplogelasinospora grovesii]